MGVHYGRGSAWRDAGVAARVGEGGLGAPVVWSFGMTTWRNKMTSTRCSDPTSMYMYIHAYGRRPRDTTMSMQQQDDTDLKAVRKWVECSAAMAELLATELLIRQYSWQ